jgi:hypothetical protein
LKKLQQLKKTHIRLLDELGAYGVCNPAKVEEMRRVEVGRHIEIQLVRIFTIVLLSKKNQPSTTLPIAQTVLRDLHTLHSANAPDVRQRTF